MVKPPENLETFESFVKIVEALRGPEGCPWDLEQTHKTLAPFAIEEAHELAEAIERGDEEELVGELGDVLLQVVLHSVIGRQSGNFEIKDVIRSISEKMVRRHPHVFSTEGVANSSEVLTNWSKIKAAEKAEKARKANTTGNSESDSLTFDIPKTLPALQRAQKIGDKTNRVGFDWPDANGVLSKLDEEILEAKEEIAKLKTNVQPSEDLMHSLEHEIGDVLFSAAQLARHVGLDAEQCLRSANARFEKRYFTMRNTVSSEGREWEGMSDPEKESAWQSAKKKADQ